MNYSLQPFFQLLHRIALRGMNYGGGSHHGDSGELKVLRRLKRLWPDSEPLCLIDAGANVGSYTLALAANFQYYRGSHLWSLEPATETFAKLQNAIMNKGGPLEISAIQIGLGRTDEVVPLYSSTDLKQSGLASVYLRRLDHFGLQLEQKDSIHLTSLDSFCQKQKISHIHFLKLDLEGHELAALEGAKTLLDKKQIDVIQFEFGGCNIDSRTFFQDFYYRLTPGYALFRITRSGLVAVPTYREEQEIFVTTNYLAIRQDLAPQMA